MPTTESLFFDKAGLHAMSLHPPW